MSGHFHLPSGASVERSRSQNIYDAYGRQIGQEKLSITREANGRQRIVFTEFDYDQFGSTVRQREFEVCTSDRLSLSVRHWSFDAFGRADICHEDRITFPRGFSALTMLRAVCPQSPLLWTMEAERSERRLSVSARDASRPLSLPAPGVSYLTRRG
jgi:hypothetical protein